MKAESRQIPQKLAARLKFVYCKHLLFSHIQRYSCMLERKCVKSCRSLQHCSGVTRFKQRTSRAIMLCGKELAVNARGERKFATLCLQATASHYFIHWFDETNFCEQPNDVTFNGDTSLFDSFHCNNVTSLNQTTWFMYTNQ